MKTYAANKTIWAVSALYAMLLAHTSFPAILLEHSFLFVLTSVLGVFFLPIYWHMTNSLFIKTISFLMPFIVYEASPEYYPHLFVAAYWAIPALIVLLIIISKPSSVLAEIFPVLMLWGLPLGLISLSFYGLGFYTKWLETGAYGYVKAGLALFAGFYLLYLTYIEKLALKYTRKITQAENNNNAEPF